MEVETRSSCGNRGQWRNSKYVGHLALGSMWDFTVRREQGDQYLGVMCRGVRGKFSGFGVVSLLVHKGMPSPNTVEPPNNGHVGDEHFVHCSEVAPYSEVEMDGQYIGRGEQFVHCREVVRSSECPLSEVPLYIFRFSFLTM